MMNGIMVPILVVGALGLILGGLLGVANLYLKVEVDPRIEKLIEMLPGYNCGSCGFPGCAGLAQHIIEKEGSINACKPCSAEAKAKINDFLKENKK